MTVWVFGASYAEYHDGLTNQWMQRVATLLNDDLKVFALVGSSMEYTYYNFNKNRHNIKDNDVVIIPLTTTSKRWFFKEYPNHTAQPAPNADFRDPKVVYDPTGYPEIDKALELYEEYLNNIEVFNNHLINFLYNLQYLTKQKNLHTIILISYWDTEYFLKDKIIDFPLLHFGKDKLLNVSLDEYSKRYLIDHDFSIKDSKVNHLLMSNHIVLADKIIDNIKYKKQIDLTKGFYKHLINENSFSDPEFIKKEMFSRGA